MLEYHLRNRSDRSLKSYPGAWETRSISFTSLAIFSHWKSGFVHPESMNFYWSVCFSNTHNKLAFGSDLNKWTGPACHENKAAGTEASQISMSSSMGKPFSEGYYLIQNQLSSPLGAQAAFRPVSLQREKCVWSKKTRESSYCKERSGLWSPAAAGKCRFTLLSRRPSLTVLPATHPQGIFGICHL